jgi:hypothetical protein
MPFVTYIGFLSGYHAAMNPNQPAPSHDKDEERLVLVPDGNGRITLSDSQTRLVDMFCKLTHKSREQVVADALKHWLERPATPQVSRPRVTGEKRRS